MPRTKTKEQLKTEIEQLQIKYNAAIEAEKSAKIKAQAKKRGQMLALIGLATIAYIGYIKDNNDKNYYLDQLYNSFSDKYPQDDDTLTERQRNKRQKDDALLYEALKMAKKGELK